jgi:hypothetical protein
VPDPGLNIKEAGLINNIREWFNPFIISSMTVPFSPQAGFAIKMQKNRNIVFIGR